MTGLLALECNAGGGTRTPDTRIMIMRWGVRLSSAVDTNRSTKRIPNPAES